ncbi:MAG: hypothetical protein JXA71_10035 [Chitinispirillaceae bacterium]|nr:hypothetical protein [Chitinispirillaceae bacterium]
MFSNNKIIILLLCFSSLSLFAASNIKHRFIGIDEGLGNLLHINQFDSTANWKVAINRTSARDMQLAGNNRVLIGHNNGYTEYDITTGAVRRELTTYTNVTSVRRLPGGRTLVVGINLDGSTGVVMLTLDSMNVKIKKTVYPGNYVRLVRQTNSGTFLFACNDSVKEADTNGAFIWKASVPTTPATEKHMWKAVRLNNGNVLLSAGYGACMVELNQQGALIRKLGAAPQPAGVNPNFYAMFQLLTNGNCVVANWQGHGAGNGSKGIQLLEFNASGAIVWQWSNPTLVSSMQGVLVIDSLNTSLLHDDRNGIMTPLGQNTGTHSMIPVLPSGVDPLVSGLYTRRLVTLNGRSAGAVARFVHQQNGSGLYILNTPGGIRRFTSVNGSRD